jgi:2-succinyl-5-enolpyruvyl-6-hydroxy-3-cyclohexene-1-carboxylate synthase
MSTSFSPQLASFMISTLIDKGVRHFFIAPGYRSSPLIKALSLTSRVNITTHIDERSLAFLALGFAKASGKMPAIILTSGTSLGNTMPAVMEAHHDQTPLLVISADRPFELQDVGANQTTYQQDFFHPFVARSLNLPSLSHLTAKSALYTALDNLLSVKNSPLHLNVSFKKPFFDKDDKLPTSLATALHLKRDITSHQGTKTLDQSTLEELFTRLSRYEKGVILVGQKEADVCMHDLKVLSKALSWPLLVDKLSCLNTSESKETMTYFDLILSSNIDLSLLAVDAVLQIGHRFISSALAAFINNSKPKLHAQISNNCHSFDVGHSFTQRYIAHPEKTLATLSKIAHSSEPTKSQTSYFKAWSRLDQKMGKAVAGISNSEPSLLGFFHTLSSLITDDSALFIGNSLTVRAASSCFNRSNNARPLITNRGLAGIDGNIATAIGACMAAKKPLIACIGDQTFLHDFSSLQLLKKCPYPVTLVVLDNGGGQIFSRVPIEMSDEAIDTFFINKSPINYGQIATLFDMDFLPIKDLSQIMLPASKHTLYVLPIDNGFCESVWSRLKNVLSAKKKPVHV